jgi:hypothetical protein
MIVAPSGLVTRWSPTTAGDGFGLIPPESPGCAWGRLTERTTCLATGRQRIDETPILVGALFHFASAASALDRVSTQGDKTATRETAHGRRPRVETGGRRLTVADRVGRSQKATRGRLLPTLNDYVGGRGGV